MEKIQAILLDTILEWPRSPCYQVAYSGGLDSTVLLHALNRVRERLPGALSAVHVNHGIHPDRGAWEAHCRRSCRELQLEMVTLAVEALPRTGASPEARARDERYRVLAGHLGADHMLLTAHNRDDQAETLLLQLCRGAGSSGLAAMPALRRFGSGWHGRPLLGMERSLLREYAQREELTWVEDDSNLDRRFDRNFIRHEILGRLRSRWPGVSSTLSRAAGHQSQTVEILAEAAARDLQECRDPGAGTLDLGRLQALSQAHQPNLLRHWIKGLELPVPDAATVQRILDEAVNARPDAAPLVNWPGAEVRRYRQHLYASAPLPPHDPALTRSWRMQEACVLDCGSLAATAALGIGLRMNACPDSGVVVRFRRGGEKIRPVGARHRRELKTLLQEQGVPPWLRDRLPLLYVGSRLAAVAHLWVEADFAAGADENGWRIHWTPA